MEYPTMTISADPAALNLSLAELDANVRYIKALQLVERIDARLEAGYHYRDARGQVLTTLEEVIRALLSDGLKMVTA